MAILKISTPHRISTEETAGGRKYAVNKCGVLIAVTGGGPFEITVVQSQLPAYLDPRTDVSRIGCGEGLTDLRTKAEDAVRMLREVQFELGKKYGARSSAMRRAI